jgi:hypothetical protein
VLVARRTGASTGVTPVDRSVLHRCDTTPEFHVPSRLDCFSFDADRASCFSQVIVQVKPEFALPTHESLVNGNKDESHAVELAFEKRIGLVRYALSTCQSFLTVRFLSGACRCRLTESMFMRVLTNPRVFVMTALPTGLFPRSTCS